MARLVGRIVASALVAGLLPACTAGLAGRGPGAELAWSAPLPRTSIPELPSTAPCATAGPAGGFEVAELGAACFGDACVGGQCALPPAKDSGCESVPE